jgi:hypothetical protein
VLNEGNVLIMIEKENVENYIKVESNIPMRKGLLSFLWIMLIVCVPSAIFGVYADVTKLIMLPLVLIISLWLIYLLIDTDNKKMQLTLFLGILSVFISVSFLIAAYKVASTEIKVPPSYVLLAITFYLIANIVSVLNTIRLIKNGYYNVQRKIENPMGIIFAAGVLGLGIGGVLIKKMDQVSVVAILVVGLIFLSFLFCIGIHNLLKYHFLKCFQKY